MIADMHVRFANQGPLVSEVVARNLTAVSVTVKLARTIFVTGTVQPCSSLRLGDAITVY